VISHPKFSRVVPNMAAAGDHFSGRAGWPA